ncbi:hypothetical protein L9F63_002707, partial [Diploptera punctata]
SRKEIQQIQIWDWKLKFIYQRMVVWDLKQQMATGPELTTSFGTFFGIIVSIYTTIVLSSKNNENEKLMNIEISAENDLISRFFSLLTEGAKDGYPGRQISGRGNTVDGTEDVS